MLSEPRICFRENQSKEKETFFKVALSGKFLVMLHCGKNFSELDHSLSLTEAAIEMFLENNCMLYDTQIIPLNIVLLSSPSSPSTGLLQMVAKIKKKLNFAAFWTHGLGP